MAPEAHGFERSPRALGSRKAALRARLRAWRGTLAPAEAAAAGRAIAVRLGALAAFAGARRVGLYCAAPGEVDTAPAMTVCRQAGKRLCVPAWDRVRKRYRFAALTPATPLRAGPLGIAQPVRPRWIDPQTIDLALVPGLAFDRHGGRLGHGGGHYDRLLAEIAPTGIRVGVAFDGQRVESVPMDRHDVRMHLLLTQTSTWICAPAPPARSLKEP